MVHTWVLSLLNAMEVGNVAMVGWRPSFGSLLRDGGKALGAPSPFFPGILLSKKTPKTLQKQRSVSSPFFKERWLKRMDTESSPLKPDQTKTQLRNSSMPPFQGTHGGINP